MAHRMTRVADLKEGDMMDLEGDEYADPSHDDHDCDDRQCAVQIFPYEYARVDAVEQETDGCVRVDTQLGSFGFPPDHLVPVAGDPNPVTGS